MILKRFFKPTAIAATLLAFTGTEGATQQSDWSFDATIYLFTPETETSLETSRGTLDGTLSFSDALENLDFAFMGAFAATNGRWSVLADYNYTNLSFSNSLSGPANGELQTSVKTQFLSTLLGYRIRQDPTVNVDVGAGFRWFSTETEFTLTPGTSPGRQAVADDSWFDPIVGARARFVLADRWTSTAYIDYGGFRSGSQTWQVLLTADYILNDRWMLRGGYRYISFDHEINGNDYTFSQSGPVFGATFRF